MSAIITSRRKPDWASAWIAVGVFLAANIIRLILLRDTGDHSLQVDYALIPFGYWSARKLNLPWTIQLVIGAMVAMTVITGDLLDIMSRRFNWSHGVVIDYAYSMPDLPWPAIMPFAALGIIAVGCSLLPFIAHRPSFPIWPLGSLVAALVAGNSLLYGSGRGDVETTRLTRSFVSHAVNGAYARLVTGRTLTPLRDGSMASDMLAAPLPAQILSVAVESFGYSQQTEARDWLMTPLRQKLRPHYSVKEFTHPFNGSTLPGEIRELCGLQADGIPNTPELLARLSSTCLPMQLRRHGYDTQAIHGNGPLMYDRRTIYPAMGFARTWFDVDLRKAEPTLRSCAGTAFGGICDVDVFHRAASLFDGHRRFVHVLTLDTHLPLPGRGAPRCSPVFSVNEGLCRYAQRTRASLSVLADTITTMRHPPDLIVIYGDHAPPFATGGARHQFADHDVPYIVIRRSGLSTS